MTTNFWNDLIEEEVHLRDRFQFEIKSEFRPSSQQGKNYYCQEYYFFVPEALQIHSGTYSESDFYQDKTLYIRYKTPEIPFDQLVSPTCEKSPLFRIKNLLKDKGSNFNSQLNHEVKLIANIVRSQLRHEVRSLIKMIKQQNIQKIAIQNLISHLKSIVTSLASFQDKIADEQFKKLFSITDQFICHYSNFYLTGLLQYYRDTSKNKDPEIISMICEALKTLAAKPTVHEEYPINEETKAHHEHLLEKYFRDVLDLKRKQRETKKSYKNMIGAIAAGIAMYIYLFFFLWKVTIFDPHSTQFIILGVIFYILKDRVKEGVKRLFERYSPRFLSDKITFLDDPNTGLPIGRVSEFFTILSLKDLPKEVVKIRNQKFHEVLRDFIRPEDVLFFRKTITIEANRKVTSRRTDINSIFRYNIHRFLAKAGESFYSVNELDPDSQEVHKKTRHHVYHINVILKSYFIDKKKEKEIQYRKFRLILDKEGLQRIENL